MYFLVKNIRSCTRFRAPNNLKLYQDGALNIDYLWRNISYFVVHPEQIRQRLKERDAHMLCEFLDSEEYKNKVTKFLETQDKILSKDMAASSATGYSSTNPIKYQHVLSCAQPMHKRPKIVDEVDEAEIQDDGTKKRVKVKRGTIIEQMLKKKGTIINDDNVSIRSEKPRRVKQVRSTIMPIFLKKIRERRHEEEIYANQQQEEPEKSEPDVVDFNNQTARKLKLGNEVGMEPLYAQILHKSNVFRKPKKVIERTVSTPSILKEGYERYHVVQPRTAGGSRMESPSNISRTQIRPKMSQNVNQLNTPSKLKNYFMDKVESKMEQKNSNKSVLATRTILDHSPYRISKISTNPEEYSMRLSGSSPVMPTRMMASSTAKSSNTPIIVKLLPKKNMNLKSYSDLLCVEPIKMSRYKMEKKKPRSKNSSNLKLDDDGKVQITVLKTKGSEGVKNLNVKKQKIKAINVSKDDEKMQKLVQNVQQNRSLKPVRLENTSYENESTMERVKKMKLAVNKNKSIEMTSLFQKVKLGSTKNADTDVVELLTSAPVAKPKPLSNLEKTILRGKKAKVAKALEEIPQSRAPKQSFTYKIVLKKRVEQEEKWREIFNMNLASRGSSAKAHLRKVKESNKSQKEDDNIVDKLTKNRFITLEESKKIVSRNIPKNLHRPVPHFVEHASKPSAVQVNQFRGKAYLMRLPKTTPEGYRVLLYSVRDPDPTKMNFNDVVKGFCMYNDCVLSEDGLEEGYIVIFDMKDVCVGHLARVSLPALKCFMYYIQDAHPCRLKQIHVLNTASWIQHVMRLIVPLVRSELLNLVKFHKGNIPDNFPIELLPMDYGGEAPTVEDLDNSTKSLLGKYRDWLVESEQLKSDESKRIKKASWWGMFSSKTPQQVELDEKTILKNLQID